ncbi:hypothetical protein [Thiopseudomonas alkaliphila]|mgnify:CR=1 FL=1|uniref:hypothetical protein n=1 Tax=Thiopseudomonas alkaliphila TaxID=1697053 RepID=UPI002576C2A5|nr:hypothetical protein [Thiopseudomonas alkaliphila]
MHFLRSSYRLIAVALSFSSTALFAVELTIGYQTGVQPSVLAQAQGEFEKIPKPHCIGSALIAVRI